MKTSDAQNALAAVRDYSAIIFSAIAEKRRPGRAMLDKQRQQLDALALKLGPHESERINQWAMRGFCILYTTPRSGSSGIVEFEICREFDQWHADQSVIERRIMAIIATSVPTGDLTVTEAATVTGFTTAMISKACSTGGISSTGRGTKRRIDRDSLIAWAGGKTRKDGIESDAEVEAKFQRR